MTNDDSNLDADPDSPTLRQRLASAMGDRHAEAKALADRAGDAVGVAEAEIAVREAHGDIESVAENDAGEHRAGTELASATDAETVRDRKSKTTGTGDP